MDEFVMSIPVKSEMRREKAMSNICTNQALMALAEDRDIKGIFDLAMKDTEQYHSLIESVGVNVITPEMRAFIDEITKHSTPTWRQTRTPESQILLSPHPMS